MSDPNDFPPVEYLNILEPFQSPQNIPGYPHNLPPLGVRPKRVYGPGGTGLELVGAAPSTILPGSAPSSGPLKNFDSAQIFDPHHYANIITAIINPVNQAVNAPDFLDAPSNYRNLLVIRNGSAAANIYIDFGKPAGVFSPIRIIPGQMILFDTVVPQDDLYVWADAAAGIMAYGYSTITGQT